MAISEEGKRQIAKELAFGIDKGHIAKMRGLTPGALANLIQSTGMDQLIASEREYLTSRMAFAMVHLNDQVENSVKNIIAIANDLEHKDSYRANTDIIGMFKPVKHESDQKVEINFNAEVINAIVVELGKMSNIHDKFDPNERLMTGDQARVRAYTDITPESAVIDDLMEQNSPDETG